MTGHAGFELQPAGIAVARVGPDTFTASDREPWLELVGFDARAFAGRFVEITYRSSLLDEPVRAVFRFETKDGEFVDAIGPAPIVGAAIWVGRVPPFTSRVLVSPTHQTGLFGFRIERIRKRSWIALVTKGLQHRPRNARSAILTRLIGWRDESDSNLSWATRAVDFSHHEAWRRPRKRDFDAHGIDRPRGETPPVAFLVVIEATGSREGLDATLRSLEAQRYQNWSILLLGAPAKAAGDRVRSIDPSCAREELATILAAATGSALIVLRLVSGETVSDFALPFLAEQYWRTPGASLFFADKSYGGVPLLLPAPDMLAPCRTHGDGHSVAIVADRFDAAQLAAFLCGDTSALVEWREKQHKVLHRIIVSSPLDFTPAASGNAVTTWPERSATAAIIILTADQPKLLRRCIESVRSRTKSDAYRLIVVDNGRDSDGADHLRALSDEGPLEVVRRPEPFNFSLFCNEAAASRCEDVLVFLNDDTEVLSDDWLERLTAHACRPEFGAVGARLTFPDGLLQHGGVVVGLGGSAGHFGAGDAGDAAGWGSLNTRAHTVSAVTAACLAVERSKFEAVGGFDAEALPIELSDIDLCLKLNARGWQTLIDPAVHLTHEESASRGGATFRRLDLYGKQRQAFTRRWRHILRDDPAFHPGLSLYSLRPALD